LAVSVFKTTYNCRDNNLLLLFYSITDIPLTLRYPLVPALSICELMLVIIAAVSHDQFLRVLYALAWAKDMGPSACVYVAFLLERKQLAWLGALMRNKGTCYSYCYFSCYFVLFVFLLVLLFCSLALAGLEHFFASITSGYTTQTSIGPELPSRGFDIH
jgi:hypothetical protein